MKRIVRGIRQRLGSFILPAQPPLSWPNLAGDREIEWSWVAANMPQGPGAVLDFGSGDSYLGLIAAQRDYDVMTIDLGKVEWPYLHPALRFMQGDLLTLDLPKSHFDLIINCSTVEHVGLAGRYGVTQNRADGDLSAMQRLRDVMKPDGIMLLTVPVGRDAVFPPLHRVYGEQRLPQLLRGYTAVKEKYMVKDDRNRWVFAEKNTALTRTPLERCYGLGCFVLRREGA